MGAPHYDIDPAEFATWLTPSDALARFPGKAVESVRRSIAERLYQGLIRSAAKTAVFMGKDDRQPYYLIKRNHWDAWAQEYDPDFWEIGDTKVPMESAAGYGAGLSMGNWFYGVRLDPDGLSAIAGYVAPQNTRLQPAPPARSDHPEDTDDSRLPVSQAKLDLWARVFVGVHGDKATEAFAWRSAKAMFPDSAVSRQRVRDLLTPRKPGRPASRDKIGE